MLEYNSLQAQEEICAGYVAMRGRDPGADATWEIAETYRDSGYSGGTLERPALQRLIQDVEEGRIQVVVVYKIDRLSRSIGQFYQVWNVLERRGVDLVSATQDLNTTTSQGKLMLNMLLSFGQFEREQIGERTRDKVAAARKKGRWTGGMPILGYDVDPRGGRLLVNEDEAALVRAIFALYLATPSLTKLVEELNRRGWRRKTWTRRDGVLREGAGFDKESLLRMLRNPLYAGNVHHRGTLHAGEHPAIVAEAAWERVQALLSRNGDTGGAHVKNKHGALLKGLIRCATCHRAMTHSFTKNRSGIRYRYYVCITRLKQGAHACPNGKVSAHEVEQQVVERIRAIGRDPVLIAETVAQAIAQLDERRQLLEAERRQLARDFGHQKAAMKRLLSGPSENGHSARRLAEIQTRIQAIEARLADVEPETQAASAEIDEDDLAQALSQFDGVWDSLWPAERARILGLLLEGIDYDGREKHAAIRFRSGGIGRLTIP